MKKLITITAILAAGTLAASATTILWTTNSAATGASDIITLYQKSSSGGAQTLTFDSTTTVNGTSNVVSLAYYIGSGRDWATDASFTTTTPNTSLASAISTDTGLTLSQFGGTGATIYGTGHSTSTTLTFSNLVANTDYRFTLVFAGRTGDPSTAASSVLTLGEGKLVTTDDCSYYGAIGGTETTTISGSSLSITTSADFYAVSVVVTANASGKVSFDATNKAGFAAIALTTIPEPSLFGLFAGTLALGLAGTRRRRRAGTQK